MATSPALLVTGASGQLGRRVVQLLVEKKAGKIVATTRKPDSLKELAAQGVEVRAADFDDAASLKTAFAGIERALLISTDAVDKPGHRVAQQKAAVKALVAAGVKHIVYTSLPNPEPGSPVTIAPDHFETEKAIKESGVGYTILRNNLYTDLLLFALPGAIASGQLIDARGAAGTAFVSREDCAAAAAGALASSFTGQQTLDVSGPEAVTSEQIATWASELAGKKITHVSVPNEALVAGMVQHGFPQVVADMYGSFDAAIAKGDLTKVTDTVQKLSGHAPLSVHEFLKKNRAALTAPAPKH